MICYTVVKPVRLTLVTDYLLTYLLTDLSAHEHHT